MLYMRMNRSRKEHGKSEENSNFSVRNVDMNHQNGWDSARDAKAGIRL